MLVYLPPASMGAAAAACSTFSKTLELPGLWRRRLAQLGLNPSIHAKLDRELDTRELRRLYVDVVTDLRWDITVSTCDFRTETDCRMRKIDERQNCAYIYI